MRLIDEIRIQLEKCGYELLKPENKKCMVNNKEIIIRLENDKKVELEPHIFEAEDIRECLHNFKITEHEPEIIDIVTGKTKKSYYSLLVERN